MGDYHNTEQPGVIVTISPAPANTAEKLFVDEDGNILGAGEKAFGVNLDTVLIADEMRVAISGLIEVAAGDTVSKGDYVTSDSAGKAVKCVEPRRMTVKTVTEAKTTTTTYAADAILKTIEVQASKKYLVNAKIVVTNAKSGTRAIKFKFVAPSGATFVGTYKTAAQLTDPLLISGENVDLLTEVVVTVDEPATGHSTETGIIEINGVLTMSTTAGNLDLDWAPNASDAAALSVLLDSYVEIIDTDPDEVNGYAVSAGAASANMLIKM